MPEAPDILSANLAQLRRAEPELAARLLETAPARLTWGASRAGAELPWATIDHEGRTLTLASRFDPLADAQKLLTAVDYQRHAGIFVLGMGLGYHVASLARQMGKDSLLVVFEPDVALLRAVLERIDHTAWLGRPNVMLIDERTDRSALVRRIERWAGMITQGAVLVTYPPARQMHAAALQNFGQMVTDAMAFCRTSVATSLVNAARTISNLTQNLPHYAAGANTNELYHAARDYPAVCVGAGPSLARNVALLADPAVRAKVIVISAQTTLKPLLDRGIRPDFVTALDYHEISRRFYEGLPPLPEVTLVAEAKAHPTVLEAFPGPVRVVANAFLDRLLGEAARPMVPIKGGATVAHLSFYLAQHLGCDPIILIGQDLGFADGLYYCPGTAIHDVWAPELGPFNTVEMMEWQRIVRHRNHLQKVEDIHGRSIYSDEQMLTYLRQFERDFAVAPQQVLDASEGGLPKEHTSRTTLAAALAQHATRPVPRLPLPPRAFEADRLDEIDRLLARRLEETATLRRITAKTIPILQQMIEHQRDQIRMDRLFAQLDANKAKVDRMPRIFGLVNDLNTLGAFKRARTDRALEHASGDEFEVQQRRVQRDLDNLDWLLQSCDEAARIFRQARDRLAPLMKSSRRVGGGPELQAAGPGAAPSANQRP